MECNKEEAFRVKRVAEKKMENKYFLKARKIAIQAQKLYPVMENISQLIMVCDVHCSAENKVHGTEMDWYGILKIEPTADDLLIRKQSRKFGLFLHPDKNKFPGAADAFKLIGEAQSVLLDQGKRWIYDMKCISAAVNGAPKQANRPSNVQQPTGHAKSSVNANKQFQQAPETDQTGSKSSRPTFWTTCPFCSMRHQYDGGMLNKNIACQTCGKSFVGTGISTSGVASHNSWSLLAVPKQTEADNQAPSEVDEQSNAKDSTKVKVGKNSWSFDTPQRSKPSERCVNVSKNCNQKRKAETPQPRGKMNEKKRKQVFESSKSCNSNSPTFWTACPSCYEVNQYYQNVLHRNLCCQHCLFTTYELGAQGVAPKNNSSQSAFPKQTGVPNQAPSGVGPRNNAELATMEVEIGRNIWSSQDTKTEPENMEYPDSDFSDFDKNREEKRFASGQIWAVYDSRDAMPRFYAQIGKVLHPKFKLRITWLEAYPDDKDEIKWAEEDLPVSCGNFKQGSSENTNDHPMFSHLVSWEKGSTRNTYKIYPRKGETWALFKRWNINWSSDPENHRKYEYEFVEVLSDYVDGTAISVAYLGKVKGYVCLFFRTKQVGVDIFQIKPKEIFRFSHRIPSFQMTGEKVLDALVGSFELDPACLPPNLQEIDPPTREEMKSRKTPSVGPCSTFITDTDVSENQAEQKKRSDSRVHISMDEEDRKLQYDASFNMFEIPTEDAGAVPDLSEVGYEIPVSVFYNFVADKILEKIEIGQVWAFYCDEDGMPKYYGMIKKIDILPKYKLTVAWLGVSSISNDIIQWIDKYIPVTCGKFKLKKMESEYTSICAFSHQVSVRVESRGTKEEYVILPRKGEIWALYKNWNAGLKCSDLETCDYDVVEIIEENQSSTTVFFLEKVDGFPSVYRAQVEGHCLVTFKIPANELLRFSNQIPAFRLTEERGGSLRGYLELDPAALPLHWFSED